MIAYYWSQFDIPADDIEVAPECSEERVLETLENAFKEQRSISDPERVEISEVTASRRYLQDQARGGSGGCDEL